MSDFIREHFGKWLQIHNYDYTSTVRNTYEYKYLNIYRLNSKKIDDHYRFQPIQAIPPRTTVAIQTLSEDSQITNIHYGSYFSLFDMDITRKIFFSADDELWAMGVSE